MLQIIRFFLWKKGLCSQLRLWAAQVPAPETSSLFPVKQEHPYFSTTKNRLKDQTVCDLFFSPVSNTTTILVTGYPAKKKRTAWVYCRASNHYRILKESARLLKRLNWDRWQLGVKTAIFTVVLPGKSLQQFEVSFNICSTDDWWSSTSSSEINAGALAGSSWEKNVGSHVCAFADFLIPASNKKHEQGEIHIRLLLTVFHALCISSTSVSNQ